MTSPTVTVSSTAHSATTASSVGVTLPPGATPSNGYFDADGFWHFVEEAVPEPVAGQVNVETVPPANAAAAPSAAHADLNQQLPASATPEGASLAYTSSGLPYYTYYPIAAASLPGSANAGAGSTEFNRMTALYHEAEAKRAQLEYQKEDLKEELDEVKNELQSIRVSYRLLHQQLSQLAASTNTSAYLNARSPYAQLLSYSPYA